MRSKLKAASYATLVMASVLVMAGSNASASTGGHLTSEASHTTIKGFESPTTGTHKLVLMAHGLGGEIVCHESTYKGTVEASTATQVAIEVNPSNCKTVGGEAEKVDVTMNGCTYLLTIAPGDQTVTEQTADLSCSASKTVEVHHPNCTITIGPQSKIAGLTYKPVVEGGKSAITVNVNAQFNTQFHGGICVLLGTNHTGTLNGSATAQGFDTSEQQVSIRTGSPVQFRSEVSHSFVTGAHTAESSYTFGVLIGSVNCSASSFDGTVAGTDVNELTIKPAYSECEGVGNRQVTTHMNGCAYAMGITGESGSHGPVEIECPEGAAIETVVDKFPEGCTLTIGEQTAGGVVDYKEEGTGAKRDLLLTWTLEGIDYERDGCEIGGKGNNGTYTGSVTLEGEDTSGNQKGLWIE